MLRDTFLYLSHNQQVRDTLMRLPFAETAASRFVAGEEPEDAIRVVRELNANRILASLDHLGENVTRPDQARAAAADYLGILDRIAASGIQSHVSVKLTQLGLDIDWDLALADMRAILDKARQVGTFVRIDMEGSDYTQRTLDLYRELRALGYDNVGVVIQAYLYRSQKDVADLIALGANVRLCKGAYKEPPEIAFPRKRDVDDNFIALARMLFSPEARARGVYAAMATHDVKIIDWVKRYTAEQGIGRDQFEFQMLYGIRRDLQRALALEGYRIRVYVPYGKEWYPYFMRRLAERPANVIFIIKSLLKEAA